MQIGFGYDAHKLARGRKLVVGGVEIKFSKGLLGWSDGDMLTHAVIDAILGALGAGDIGQYFPAGDKKYKNILSLKLLAFVAEMLREKGYAVNNLDTTIVAEQPRFAPYIEQIRRNLAAGLEIKPEQVNVKAKTEEGLGFTGAGKGMAAYAVCLLHKEVKGS